MRYLPKGVIGLLICVNIVILFWILLQGKTVALLQPQGIVAFQERELLIFATALSATIVIPFFIAMFFVVVRFQDGNHKAKYTPDWTNGPLQLVWWALPTLIITILAVVTWKSTHTLDPYRALASDTKPLTIQVVALQWKWLFIYPEYDIATVNYIAFPQKTPINFELTADAPMNSFWIPQLGGQIYAMEGMITKTHLMADGIGKYRGTNAEISGEGFTGMTFTAHSTSQTDFANWVKEVKGSPAVLSKNTYESLTIPSEKHKVSYYSSVESGLYNGIVMRFMSPSAYKKDNKETVKQIEHTEHSGH